MLKGVNERDIVAFECLFHKYYASLRYYTARILHDEDAACDIVHDAFITLWNKYIRFDDLDSLKSFLYMVVHRKALSYRSKQDNRRRIQMSMKHGEYSEAENENFIAETEFFQVLSEAMKRLPTECRRIFELSYIDHLNVKDICSILGVAESTVKTQRSRAKKVLQEVLKNYKFDR